MYVWTGTDWLQAKCRNLLELGHLSETERRSISDEYRNRNGKKVNEEVSAVRLKEFMKTFKPEGAMALAFERQAQNKQLYSSLEIANISPIELPKKPGISLIETSEEAPPTLTKFSRKPKQNTPPINISAIAEDDTSDLFDTF